MSKNSWTKEQEKAISERNCSLLVSAAAGAGKTAVLVERIVRRILDEYDPVDVDKVLVVTFTNAAALEMKERIGGALSCCVRENPESTRLQRQQLLMGKSSICTLHSFCLEIVRQNYYKLQLPENLVLDPRFRIADDIETVLLKFEVLEDYFEGKYEDEDSIFLDLVEGMGGERDDKSLKELVLKLYNFSRSQPDSSFWLKEAVGVFNANIEDSIVQNLFARIMASMVVSLHEAVELLKEAKELAMLPEGPYMYCDNLITEIDVLEEIIAVGSKSWKAGFETLAEFKFSSLKRCKVEVDEGLKEEVQTLRKQARDLVRNLQNDYLSRSPEALVQDMQDIAPMMECLCKMVDDFSFLYLKKKLEKNIIDFNDIEHFALALLGTRTQASWQPTELAKGLRKKYEEVLVDEYQDINAAQEAILSLVSREAVITSKADITDSSDVAVNTNITFDSDVNSDANFDVSSFPNMFMVGDVKQSIYGFRLAEPKLFLKKYKMFETDEESLEKKIVLAKNFRSKRNVVDGVNFIFRQVMGSCLGGISYDSENELVFGANFGESEDSADCAECPLELHIIDRNIEDREETNEKKDTDSEMKDLEGESGSSIKIDEEELDAIQAEARLVGKRILELMANRKTWDKEDKIYRSMEFSDVVVLLRSIKSAAPTFIDEFRKLGIPVYAETGSGYFAAQEVQVILSLLKVIDNPLQDIFVAAVLLSPVVGLSTEELARIRLVRSDDDLYNAVRLAARKEEGALKNSLRMFLKKLKRWRTFARHNSLIELIWLLYRETGFYDYAGAMPGGKQRQANLRALLDRAKQFEDTSMKGLFKFLRFLERLENSGSDLGTARAIGEKENVVRIMSIHKSKGLEFPLVFVAGLGKQFNMQELRGDILLDRELGLGPVWVDLKKRLKYPTLAKLVVKDKLQEELLAEEIRILYVAFTRARENLILVGSVRDIDKNLKKWSSYISQQGWDLPRGALDQARCPMDWLGSCILRHREGIALLKKIDCKKVPWELTQNDQSHWKICLWDKEKIRIEEKSSNHNYDLELSKVRELLPLGNLSENNSQDKIIKSLGWSYPYQGLADIPAKLSVTEIKNRFHLLMGAMNESKELIRFRRFEKRPKFLQEQSLSASEKGTILHLFMRHLDFEVSSTEKEVKGQLEEMLEKQILNTTQANTIVLGDVVSFVKTPLGQRIKNGTELRREVPFTLEIPAVELYSEVKNITKETITLQGTIDCLFKEGEEYIIVDYKTDVVALNSIDSLKERYKIQMELYARAVESIFHSPVKEKLLYSFYLQKSFAL